MKKADLAGEKVRHKLPLKIKAPALHEGFIYNVSHLYLSLQHPTE